MLCSENIRFVIFSSYGNDSCALIQWAHEWQLEGVAVVYSDTGWATVGWEARVTEKEAWVRSLGFTPEMPDSAGKLDASIAETPKPWWPLGNPEVRCPTSLHPIARQTLQIVRLETRIIFHAEIAR